jgi:hypothetical protein
MINEKNNNKNREFNIYFLGKLGFGLLGLMENKKRAHPASSRNIITVIIIFFFWVGEVITKNKKQITITIYYNK